MFFENMMKYQTMILFHMVRLKKLPRLGICLPGDFDYNYYYPQVADSNNELARSNATKWAESVRYQVSRRHHYTSTGPNVQGIRWGFENSIKYIIISAAELADEGGDDDGFKIMVSDYVKNVVIQSVIDTLKTIKVRTVVEVAQNRWKDGFIKELKVITSVSIHNKQTKSR